MSQTNYKKSEMIRIVLKQTFVGCGAVQQQLPHDSNVAIIGRVEQRSGGDSLAAVTVTGAFAAAAAAASIATAAKAAKWC